MYFNDRISHKTGSASYVKRNMNLFINLGIKSQYVLFKIKQFSIALTLLRPQAFSAQSENSGRFVKELMLTELFNLKKKYITFVLIKMKQSKPNTYPFKDLLIQY